MKHLKARDMMIKDVTTIGCKEKIALADLIMTRSSIGGLPVVDGEKLVGIITQRDIMLARNYDIGGLSAEDLMNKNPITISPNTGLKEIMKVLLDKKIERLPVVERGKIVGLIVHGQILKAVYDSL
ncbi:MAG: CBS domain-containing protein [Candidatus Hydrothermarchaeaceae archaeon]